MARDMKSALTKSLVTERKAVEDRFSKAESIIGGGEYPVQQEKRTKPGPKLKQPFKRVIRDSFTMPEEDYRLIAQIKSECMRLGIEVNKGEIVRAGIKLLASMKSENLRQAIRVVERVKTGRPKVD
jgi:hypothetical protein